MWWKVVIFIVCTVHIFMTGRAKHVYKCAYQGFYRDNLGIVTGSIVSTLVECVAGWYFIDTIVKMF